MNFILRNVQTTDLKDLHSLASQFHLLNLPADKKVLSDKIERSVASFSGDLPREKAEYLFVVEDIEQQMIVGSSLIMAKHGTEDVPHTYFKIIRKNKFSENLGIGFIHQVLQFREDTDGPTEIGGLLIDRAYRRRPEKLGRQISMVRFVYMGMYQNDFEKRVLCELTPPLGDGGRSEFWEALGRRFTGLPYQEADVLSQQNREFISSLFPEEDIYLALLDSKARLTLGRVGEETLPAQHLLESIGFKYLNEVDPFDGGPHYGADLADISIVKNGQWATFDQAEHGSFPRRAFVAAKRDGEFRCVMGGMDVVNGKLHMPAATAKALEAEPGEKFYFSSTS
jgi:arginine N-succinyltransferase